jgi:DNA helicase-2/ATP-dependent DNA helicase PcrA
MSNKLVIAAAGSGKTTSLVNDALEQTGKVLITTFTQANEAEIRKKIIQRNGCIPDHIVVQTWFSFLLQHGVRPFQGKLVEKKVKGLLLVNGLSGVKCTGKFGPVYFKEETEMEQHFFTKDMKIYSDKLSKFVIRSQTKSDGAVINRLSSIYSKIYIDEVQDLSGYDLEILKLLFASPSSITIVGDPRQGTYSTNNAAKNKKYQKSKITHFFEDKFDIETDDTSLTVNYRCVSDVCNLSNNLFPDFKGTTSGNSTTSDHDGVFFIKSQDVNAYLAKYKPIQLRDKKNVIINEDYNSINFGESKGLSFDRILIYPTTPMLNWLLDNTFELAPTSRSKFYVALTRARQSVGIIYDYTVSTNVHGIINY